MPTIVAESNRLFLTIIAKSTRKCQEESKLLTAQCVCRCSSEPEQSHHQADATATSSCSPTTSQLCHILKPTALHPTAEGAHRSPTLTVCVVVPAISRHNSGRTPPCHRIYCPRNRIREKWWTRHQSRNVEGRCGVAHHQSGRGEGRSEDGSPLIWERREKWG
jgi:hypothetical protein